MALLLCSWVIRIGTTTASAGGGAAVGVVGGRGMVGSVAVVGLVRITLPIPGLLLVLEWWLLLLVWLMVATLV